LSNSWAWIKKVSMNTFKSSKHIEILGLALLVGLAVLTRIIPHPANMTAVSALGLLLGAALTKRSIAVLAPIAALFISDLALGFHDQMWSVYLSVALITLLGHQALGQKFQLWNSKLRFFGVSTSSSLISLTLTNLAVWWQSAMYTHTPAGLAKCFAMALPFLGNQLAGDMFYSALFLGAYGFIRQGVQHPAQEDRPSL
jgi:hypothetical protein